MNITKKFLAILLFLSVELYAQVLPDFGTGNGFIETWKEYKKWDGGSRDVNFIFVGYFMGFVDVADWALAFQNLIDTPKGATNGQAYRIVGKYLEDHPELLHLSSFILTETALVTAFPKKK